MTSCADRMPRPLVEGTPSPSASSVSASSPKDSSAVFFLRDFFSLFSAASSAALSPCNMLESMSPSLWPKNYARTSLTKSIASRDRKWHFYLGIQRKMVFTGTACHKIITLLHVKSLLAWLTAGTEGEPLKFYGVALLRGERQGKNDAHGHSLFVLLHSKSLHAWLRAG